MTTIFQSEEVKIDFDLSNQTFELISPSGKVFIKASLIRPLLRALEGVLRDRNSFEGFLYAESESSFRAYLGSLKGSSEEEIRKGLMENYWDERLEKSCCPVIEIREIEN